MAVEAKRDERALAHSLKSPSPCPLSGKPDIEPTSPNDQVLTRARGGTNNSFEAMADAPTHFTAGFVVAFTQQVF
jgi:hypothetical protein